MALRRECHGRLAGHAAEEETVVVDRSSGALPLVRTRPVLLALGLDLASL